MLKKKILVAFLLLLFPAGARSDSGTGVGNGGDPVFSFLSGTRFAYVEALKEFGLDSDNRESFCATSKALNPEQQTFCREFLGETLSQLLALNGNQGRTEFVLRREPLLVEGPDGKPMPVAAKTALGPAGVIEFHRPSIAYYPPRQMLFLIAHEFGHKAIFRGRPVADNERIGPFSSGRDLLDAVAEAVVTLAEAKGRIGKSFGLRDFWQCQIVFPNGFTTGASAASLRLFYRNDLDQYETGISRTPDDPQIFAYEGLNSRLVFRIRVRESLGCLQAATPESRGTKLEIIRVKEQNMGEVESDEEIVNSLYLPSVNPICEETPRWLELSAGGVNFRCKYSGSQGGFQ